MTPVAHRSHVARDEQDRAAVDDVKVASRLHLDPTLRR
jgi:hypothetical protein